MRMQQNCLIYVWEVYVIEIVKGKNYFLLSFFRLESDNYKQFSVKIAKKQAAIITATIFKNNFLPNPNAFKESFFRNMFFIILDNFVY